MSAKESLRQPEKNALQRERERQIHHGIMEASVARKVAGLMKLKPSTRREWYPEDFKFGVESERDPLDAYKTRPVVTAKYKLLAGFRKDREQTVRFPVSEDKDGKGQLHRVIRKIKIPDIDHKVDLTADQLKVVKDYSRGIVGKLDRTTESSKTKIPGK